MTFMDNNTKTGHHYSTSTIVHQITKINKSPFFPSVYNFHQYIWYFCVIYKNINEFQYDNPNKPLTKWTTNTSCLCFILAAYISYLGSTKTSAVNAYAPVPLLFWTTLEARGAVPSSITCPRTNAIAKELFCLGSATKLRGEKQNSAQDVNANMRIETRLLSR